MVNSKCEYAWWRAWFKPVFATDTADWRAWVNPAMLAGHWKNRVCCSRPSVGCQINGRTGRPFTCPLCVNLRPTIPCFSGSFSGALPEAPFCRLGSTWSAAFLTAELRRVIFLCVTLRRALRNSAVKRTQTHLQPSKVFWIYPWCQARPADPGRCVSTPAGRFGDPRSTSWVGSCHMKICLGQRSSYRKYEARCGWSGVYLPLPVGKKCFGYTRGVKIGLLTQAAVFPRLQVLLHQRWFGDPRSASCTGSCHMKICLRQRSSYRKYEARCGWSGVYPFSISSGCNNA